MPIVKISNEDRKKLGIRLAAQCQEAERAKSTLLARWQRNEALWRVAPETSTLKLAEGMEAYAMPLWRSKGARIAGSTYSAFTGLYPYVQVIEETADAQATGSNEESVERALMVLALESGFDKALFKAIVSALNTGIGVIRVRTTERQDKINIECGNVNPRHHVASPTYVQDPDSLQLLGHRFYLPAYRVKERQIAGDYYKEADVQGGDDPKTYEDGYVQKQDFTQALDTDETPVELIELETYTWFDSENDSAHTDPKEGRTRRFCRVVLAPTAQEVLRIEPLDEPIWTYIAVRLSSDEDTYYPSNCPSQLVQGLNLCLNDMFSACLQGSLIGSAPPIAIIGGQMSGPTKKYGVADLIELPEGASIEVLRTEFNPGFLPALIEKVEQMADSVTGVGRLGTAQNLQSGTTATEAGAVIQAQQEGKDHYVDAVSPSVRQIFELLFYLLKTHYEELVKSYGPGVAVADGALAKNYRFEVTGKSQDSNPQIMLQKLQMVGQMAQNPMSVMDAGKVEEKIVQSMDFPFSADSLKKDALSEASAALLQLQVQLGVDPREVVQLGANQVMEQKAEEALAQGISQQAAMSQMPQTGVE